MVNSYVTRAEIQGNKIVLSVQLEGFEKGETVELTGSVTQNDAFALIHSVQTVRDRDFEGDADLKMSVPAKGFSPGTDVTVVLKAAKIWMTVLKENQEDKAQGIAAWDANYAAQPGQAGQGPNWP